MNWIMLSCTTTGNNTGVKIAIAAKASINVPTNNKKRLIIRRITILLFEY